MSLTFLKGPPLTSLFRFLPHLFLQEMFICCQLRVAYILSVYAPWVEMIGQKFFWPLKTKRLNKRRSNQFDKSISMEWLLNYIANRYMVRMIIFFGLAHHVNTKNTLFLTKHRQVNKRHIRVYVAKPL